MTAVSQSRAGAPPVQRDAAITVVRGMIADGTLKPGDLAPSGPGLGRKAGCHPGTARDALRLLVEDGTLVEGVGRKSRLRVPQSSAELNREAQLIEAPSRTLAGLRRDRKMTQRDLADDLGVPIKTIERAETGRLWQSRKFWQQAEAELGGDLLRLFDTSQAVRAGLPSVTAAPDSVLITWLDGTQALVRAPGRQDPENSGAGTTPSPAPEPYPHRKEAHRNG